LGLFDDEGGRGTSRVDVVDMNSILTWREIELSQSVLVCVLPDVSSRYLDKFPWCWSDVIGCDRHD
jgi:hypothetical protein